MSPKADAKKTSKKSGETFTADEKAAMKARAQELKDEARASKNREEGEKAILASIAGMKGQDRVLAGRLHEIVQATAPDLLPKTWYGMPAYTNKDGKVLFFFQAAGKFNTRYATLGFQHDAKLDDGKMWSTSFALTELTASEEARIKALVKKAVG